MQETITATYTETFEAATEAILIALQNKGRMSSSEVYASTNLDFTWNIKASINALNLLVKQGRVTDTHEMVDGYISTHFHAIA